MYKKQFFKEKILYHHHLLGLVDLVQCKDNGLGKGPPIQIEEN